MTKQTILESPGVACCNTTRKSKDSQMTGCLIKCKALQELGEREKAVRQRDPATLRYLNRRRYIRTKIGPGSSRIKLQTEQVYLLCILILKLRTQAEAQTKQESQQQQAKENQSSASLVEGHLGVVLSLTPRL